MSHRNCLYILEMLKRKDELIFRCLLDKQKILTQLCNLPHDDDAPGDISMEIKGNKEARELALAAIVQSMQATKSTVLVLSQACF